MCFKMVVIQEQCFKNHQFHWCESVIISLQLLSGPHNSGRIISDSVFCNVWDSSESLLFILLWVLLKKSCSFQRVYPCRGFPNLNSAQLVQPKVGKPKGPSGQQLISTVPCTHSDIHSMLFTFEPTQQKLTR